MGVQSNNWYQHPRPLTFLIPAPVAPWVHKLVFCLDLGPIFLLLHFSLCLRHFLHLALMAQRFPRRWRTVHHSNKLPVLSPFYKHARMHQKQTYSRSRSKIRWRSSLCSRLQWMLSFSWIAMASIQNMCSAAHCPASCCPAVTHALSPAGQWCFPDF